MSIVSAVVLHRFGLSCAECWSLVVGEKSMVRKMQISGLYTTSEFWVEFGPELIPIQKNVDALFWYTLCSISSLLSKTTKNTGLLTF